MKLIQLTKTHTNRLHTHTHTHTHMSQMKKTITCGGRSDDPDKVLPKGSNLKLLTPCSEVTINVERSVKVIKSSFSPKSISKVTP